MVITGSKEDFKKNRALLKRLYCHNGVFLHEDGKKHPRTVADYFQGNKDKKWVEFFELKDIIETFVCKMYSWKFFKDAYDSTTTTVIYCHPEYGMACGVSLAHYLDTPNDVIGFNLAQIRTFKGIIDSFYTYTKAPNGTTYCSLAERAEKLLLEITDM